MKALRSLATLSLALFLTSCSLTQQVADAPSDAAKAQPQADAGSSREKADAPAPSAEQQKAAQELLSETAPAPTAHTEDDNLPPQDSPAAPDATPPASTAAGVPLPSGGLRMGSIIPKEDPASVGDAPAPTANSVELRGLRSPKMPSKLPMGIDGKLKSN